MLNDLLARTTARIHLTGHSFGAKVVLSALALHEQPRNVTSVLLLQPAINAFCFASRIAENEGKPGAFKSALDSDGTANFFDLQLSATRRSAGFFTSRCGGTAIWVSFALQRGRRACSPHLEGSAPAEWTEGENKTVVMVSSPGKYDLSNPKIRLYALDGSDNRITGHGDVRNQFTEWALINLVSGKQLS